MNKTKLTIYPRELLLSIFMVMLPTSMALELNTSWSFFAYTDEALCIISVLYIIYFSFKRGISKKDVIIIILTLALSLLTIIGNTISGITGDWFSIAVDFISLLKMFTVFIVYKQVSVYDKKRKILQYLVPISKLLILSASFFGLISMFFDIGMTGERRYGIPSYSFIFVNEARFGYIIACALLILMIANVPRKKFITYEALAIFCMIISTKGVVYIVIVCYFLLRIMWRKKEKASLSPLNIATIAAGSLIVSSYQVNTYLRDDSSPRMMLIKYGFITANTYFPFGSGFATYGSDQAAKNYSSLYLKYGFNNLFGMSMQDPRFLNDCYIGMVLGEFGYLGTILFIVILILIYTTINKIDNLGKPVKALIMAIFIGLVISSVGTAIIKSSIGVFIFAILGTACGYANNMKRNKLNS